MDKLTDGEILGRKLTFSPFIPHGRGLNTRYYTVTDFLLDKYGVMISEVDSIDRGGAISKYSRYHTIFAVKCPG